MSLFATKLPTLGRRDMIRGIATAGATTLLGGKVAAATSSDSLASMSVVQIRDMIAKRTISATEVTRYFLDRIEKLEPLVHAFLYVDAEGALKAARQIDADLKSGKSLGPLAGIPIAVKDQALAKDMPATAGSLLFANFRPSIDGTIVERLRAAGAIIIGKTNLSEFASWPRSKNYLGGETLNPWDLGRIAGASSGGSAAAVAAGMVPAAIATDGGGSTRIPAALCGMVGLLPTVGRVPDFGGFRFGTDGSAGPLTRTVEDAALIQQIIAGPDARVPSALSEAAPNVMRALHSGVEGLRIAWSPDFGRIPVDPLIVQAASPALAALSLAGAKVEEYQNRIEHPWGDGTLTAGLQRAISEGDFDENPSGALPDSEGVEAWLIGNSRGAGMVTSAIPEFRELASKFNHLLTPSQRMAGKYPPVTAGLPRNEDMRKMMSDIFTRYDLLCSPTMSVIAPEAKPGWGSPYDDMFMGTNFTFIANATHSPAVSVPCGFVRDMPVGFQIIGRHGDEATVLRAAQSLQKSLPQLPLSPLARV